MLQPPSDVAHSPLTMEDTSQGSIDGIGVVPGAAVQMVLLLMRIIARGINDAHIAMTVRVDIDTDTDHARSRPLLISHLAPKRCRRGWVPGIDPPVRELPVSLRWQKIALAISLDAKLSYAANSKGS